MYNGNSGPGYGPGNGYAAQPHAAMTPPEEQTSDRDDTYAGGLAGQDINAQHYTVQVAVDDQLTYGEGRTYHQSNSFADYPPHTLVGISVAPVLPMTSSQSLTSASHSTSLLALTTALHASSSLLTAGRLITCTQESDCACLTVCSHQCPARFTLVKAEHHQEPCKCKVNASSQ